MSKWRCYNLFEKVEGFAVNVVLVVTEYYTSGGKLLLKVEEHVCLTFHFTPPANFLSSLLALQTNAIKFNVVFLVCLGVGLWVFRINMLSALWRWRVTTPNIMHFEHFVGLFCGCLLCGSFKSLSLYVRLFEYYILWLIWHVWAVIWLMNSLYVVWI